MKVLSFGVLYFKLPDDFQGGFSAALRALASYHDSVTGKPQQDIGAPTDPPSDKTAKEHAEEIWGEFWDAIHVSDRCVYGVGGLMEYPEGKEGIHLDLNTGEPDPDPNTQRPETQ